MARTTSRIPATSSESLTDMVFGFLDDGFAEESPENTCSSGDGYDDEGDEEEDSFNVEESKLFWEEQEQLLQVKLFCLFV